MKNRLVFILLATLIVSGCGPASSPAPGPTETPKPVETLAPIATLTFPPTTAATAAAIYPSLPREASWQIQYTGEELETSLDVDVFNLDLFDTPSASFETLRSRGVFVMCYFSAGSYEDWRPDASAFPDEVLGKDMEGWPGEKWLDIRRIDLLAPIIEARLELAVEKQCDGVDPDNINGYTNDTGFPLTAEDQIAFNIYLSEAAHQRGLAIGLKNDLEQIPELVAHFDWIINEECFSYGECELLLPFAQAGKPIFVIEYELQPADFCPQALELGFNALHKHWELDAYRVDCRQFSGP